jgi:hypothetical protein
MARLCEGVTKEGRVRLYPDEVNIIKRALRKLLLPSKEKFSAKDEMLIINTYHKLVYKDEKTTSDKKDS